MEPNTKCVGCCGHDCSRCVTYLATIRDDDGLRRQARQFYRDTFQIDLPADAFHCLGCRSEEVFLLCRDCPFTACADRHGVTHCADCSAYPCPALADYMANYVNRCNQIPPEEPLS